ncbi:MAG: hypothetical protein ACK4KV_05015 [Rhodocyclaceae bacterium]
MKTDARTRGLTTLHSKGLPENGFKMIIFRIRIHEQLRRFNAGHGKSSQTTTGPGMDGRGHRGGNKRRSRTLFVTNHFKAGIFRRSNDMSSEASCTPRPVRWTEFMPITGLSRFLLLFDRRSTHSGLD